MDDFEVSATQHERSNRLYQVSLRGVPEVFSAQRLVLEERFHNSLNAQFDRGEAAVRDCLHTHQDALKRELARRCWDEAVRNALQVLNLSLPPGGRFECSPLPLDNDLARSDH